MTCLTVLWARANSSRRESSRKIRKAARDDVSVSILRRKMVLVFPSLAAYKPKHFAYFFHLFLDITLFTTLMSPKAVDLNTKT